MLFSSLLQDRCCIVHLNALETFAHVAEQNTHESILSEILNSSGKLCEVVAVYLSQVKISPCLSNLPIEFITKSSKLTESICYVFLKRLRHLTTTVLSLNLGKRLQSDKCHIIEICFFIVFYRD